MLSRVFAFRLRVGKERRSGEPFISNPAPAPNLSDDIKSIHSRSSQISLLSKISTRRHSGVDPGPLGLNVIYTPANGHKADIVFIHGLGGSSRMTWLKDRNPNLFWPLTFLPLEPDICLARILSFGYNASFARGGNAAIAVLDFAKDLLYDLKYATDGRNEGLNLGQVPLIFVVHSMGGLIVKEAYMQGQNDPEYEEIIKAVSSIIFLATPHRGTNLAVVLNRILQSTPVTQPKQYISELTRNSFTLQKLNEQFRHIAPKLDIVSFYETRPTSIGLENARVMVLEKDSSILGYPGEISRALDADHHGVCKYEDLNDPNYVTVRNILKSLASKIISTNRPEASNQKPSRNLKTMLAISALPEEDYIFFRDQWTPGTNEWIFEEEPYTKWLHSSDVAPHVLHIKGGPACGKSVLCSFIINNLVEQGFCCQYFFLRFGDRRKRTLSALLRSMAYQIAQSLPTFRQKVIDMEDEAIDFESADPKIIWERLFKSVLFKLDEQRTLYWVIDGLDEANDGRSITNLFADITKSSIPIQVLLLSRENSEIEASLQNIPETVRLGTVRIEGHLKDLRCYIDRELNMPGTTEFKESIAKRILADAQNNFLWARLAVEKINSCHTRLAVEQALQEFPLGMEALYDRMGSSIMQHPSPSDRSLASAILQRVTCSFRNLTVMELAQALGKDTLEALDMQHSLTRACCGFIVIDNDANVTLIHQTAREYLLGDVDRPFHIDRNCAHELMFFSCMQCLMSSNLRAKLNKDSSEFLGYSAAWWSSHLASISPERDGVAKVLSKFLTGPWVLTWIHILAAENRLRILVQASKHLSKYANRRRWQAATWTEKQQLVEQESIESWAVDLAKIVGKFGHTLRQRPAAIYRLIPPFCPHQSAMYQQFGVKERTSLAVSGFSAQTWDDSLARLSFDFGVFASSISTAGAHIAVLASSGSVYLYDSSIFEEAAASPIKHGERVYRMKLNTSGTLLVTYGFRTTRVWETTTGRCKLTAGNPKSRPRPLVMLLTDESSTLLVGADDKSLRSLSLTEQSPTWQLVAKFEEEELDGHFLNAASYMALNNDGSLLAVAYRGHPISAWEVGGSAHIGHCWRARKEVARGEVIEAVWHPHNPEVLGLYIEGVVFKWNPYCGEPEEIGTGASRLAMSADGNLFATGDVQGTVKVYTISGFRLLYQSASQDNVFGLAFSPDQHRLYDIRGSYGNAWEPTALIRYAEEAGKGADSDNETESLALSSNIPAPFFQRIDPVTVVAASPTGRLYCCGTEYGQVRMFDVQSGKVLDIQKTNSFLSIEQLVWSESGEWACFANSSKKLSIVSICTTGSDISSTIHSEVSLKNHTEGAISQLLFQPEGSQIFVSTFSTICIISLESASITCSAALPSHECKWITHPHDSTLILGFGPTSITLMDWNLTEKGNYRIQILPDPSFGYGVAGETGSRLVDRVLVTQDKRHILVQRCLGRSHKDKEFLYFTTSAVSPGPTDRRKSEQLEEYPTITAALLPSQLRSQIGQILCFLKRNRLVFLSRKFSVCSWQMPSFSDLSAPIHPSGVPDDKPAATEGTASLITQRTVDAGPAADEIFALPADWISRASSEICVPWLRERSFLYPRNGEVAVVKCASFV